MPVAMPTPAANVVTTFDWRLNLKQALQAQQQASEAEVQTCEADIFVAIVEQRGKHACMAVGWACAHQDEGYCSVRGKAPAAARFPSLARFVKSHSITQTFHFLRKSQ